MYNFVSFNQIQWMRRQSDNVILAGIKIFIPANARIPFIKIDGYVYFTFYSRSDWSEALPCCSYWHGNVKLFVYLFIYIYKVIFPLKSQFISARTARVWSSNGKELGNQTRFLPHFSGYKVAIIVEMGKKYLFLLISIIPANAGVMDKRESNVIFAPFLRL